MPLSLRRTLVHAVLLTAVGCAICGACLAVPAAAALPPELRSLGAGGWTWFADPRGVYHRGRHSRTYVGWLDREGDIKIASYDHTSKLRTTAVLHWGLGVDDHNNPALTVRPDGRIVVFYSEHNGAKMYHRTSRNPEDVTSWGRERSIPTNTRKESTGSVRGNTYPNPVWLAAERRLWLLWRGGSSWPTFASTGDGGRTWTRARDLIRSPHHRPYLKAASNNKDLVHFAFTKGHPSRGNTNIYYARYKRGSFYRANGRRIGSMSSLPLELNEVDKVHAGGREKTWIHDVAADASGRPILVYASFASSRRHYYWYARWTGGRWVRHRFVAAGGTIADNGAEPWYSGGVTIDQENPSVVYLSREVKGMHEVETWRTPNGGSRWTRAPVTSGSSVENVRPVSPRGLRNFGTDMSVLFMRGNYRHYIDYETNITTWLLNGGNLPPASEAKPATRVASAPEAVRFDGSPASDPDGRIVDFAWDFGDGSGDRGRALTHRYNRPGHYFPKLTVTDDNGDKDVFVEEVAIR